MRNLALLSTWYKEGLATLAKAFVEQGMELVSTGKTREVLEKEGLKVIDISELTGEPERFGGRVKTLHHKVLGGILFRPEMDEKEWPYDFRIAAVVCNFYPFEEKAKEAKNLTELIEWVDVGGPTMVRAAAKNFEHVWIFSKTSQYARFIGKFPGEDLALRKRLALEAFEGVAELDIQIKEHLTWQILLGQKDGKLRYGENPHQAASFVPRASSALRKHGELSYNNLRDAEAALRFVMAFQSPAVSVVKHQTLCGAALGSLGAMPDDVFHFAWEGDTISRFGGVLAFNHLPSEKVADELSKKFIEVLVIPRSDKNEMWLARFSEKNQRTRILEVDFRDLKANKHKESYEGILGTLTQEADSLEIDFKEGNIEGEKDAFGIWSSACTKSNAMSICGFDHDKKVHFLAGAGQGQPNRVDALKLLAIPRARSFSQRLKQDFSALSIYSDAFLPFEDNLEAMKEAGLKRLIQPGGSKRDEEVKKAAIDLGLDMKILGRRHFWH